MLIKSIEEKIAINKKVSLFGLLLALIVSLSSLFVAYKLVKDSRKSLYVLDHGTPILLRQSDVLVNRSVEYKSQVELFHQLFFSLAPDEKFIEQNLGKSLYLIDESGKKEYTNLKEKGFYNQLISSSSMVSLLVDSIQLDEENQKFAFFGKQVIHRRTAVLVRSLKTKGSYKDLIRSPQNPHGVLLMDWSIVENKELSSEPKYAY